MKYKEKYERLLASEDYLRDLVENQKISMNKLDANSEEYFGFKVSRAIIKNVLDELGIQTQKPKRKKDLKPFKEEILDYSRRGYKNKEIAKLLTEEHGMYIADKDISAFFKEENELKAIDLQQIVLLNNIDIVSDLVVNKGYTIPMIMNYFKNEKDVVVSKSAVFQFLKKNNIEQNKALAEQNRLERIKQTNQELYGVDNVFTAPEVKDKIEGMQNEELSRLYNVDRKEFDKIREIRTDKEKLKLYLIHEQIENNGRLLNREVIANKLYVTIARFSEIIKKFKLESFFTTYNSTAEVFIIQFLDELQINYELNNRVLISPKEIDIYFPEDKIGIEINPSYTHNSTAINHWGNKPKDKYYHQNKYIETTKVDIQLIQLYDWDFEKFENLKEYLKQQLKVGIKTIDMKDCKVVKINEEKAEAFLNRNTLEGYKKAELFLSLKYKDEIVAVLSFKQNENNTYKCIQYSEKEGYSINNGLKRLFDAFVKLKQPEKCDIILDINKYNSTMFTKLGFEVVQLLEPRVYYVNTRTKDIKEVNNNNLLEQGYVEVYDAGRLKMSWKNKFTNREM